jgi:hypothetical protein
MKSVSRLRIDKHVPAATNTHTTIELLLETVFSARSIQSGYTEENCGAKCPLEKPSTFIRERILHKDYYRKNSVGKNSLVMGLKGPGAKTN